MFESDIEWFYENLEVYSPPTMRENLINCIYEFIFKNKTQKEVIDELNKINSETVCKIIEQDGGHGFIRKILVPILFEHDLFCDINLMSILYLVKDGKRPLVDIINKIEKVSDEDLNSFFGKFDSQKISLIKRHDSDFWRLNKDGCNQTSIDLSFLDFILISRKSYFSNKIESQLDLTIGGKYNPKDRVDFQVQCDLPDWSVVSLVDRYVTKKEFFRTNNWDINAKYKDSLKTFLSLIDQIRNIQTLDFAILMRNSYKLVEGIEDDSQICADDYGQYFKNIKMWRNFNSHLLVSGYSRSLLKEVLSHKTDYFNVLKKNVIDAINCLLTIHGEDKLEDNSLDYLMEELITFLEEGIFDTNIFKDLKGIRKILVQIDETKAELIISKEELEKLRQERTDFIKEFEGIQKIKSNVKNQSDFDNVLSIFNRVDNLKKRYENTHIHVTYIFKKVDKELFLIITRMFPHKKEEEEQKLISSMRISVGQITGNKL